jgi:hypothetical protein
MMEPTRARPSRVGGILTLLGGVIVIVSSFIDWGHPEAKGPGIDVAIQVRGGGLALVSGVLLIVAGLLLLLVRARGLRVVGAVLGTLVGLAMLAFSLIFVVGDGAFRSAWASGCVSNHICKGVTSDQLKKSLDREVASGNVDFNANRKIGVDIALIGGVVGFVGGVAGFRRGRSSAPAAPSAAWQQPGYAPTGGVPPAAAPPYGAAPPAVPPPAGPPPSGPPPAGPPPAAPPPAGPPPAAPPPAAPPPASPPPPAGDGGSFTQ